MDLEQKLRQLFKNRSNCYADADDVVQAMDENCFIKTVKEALRIHGVVGRSEQLVCPNCDGEGFSGKGTNEILPCLSCFGSGERAD